MSTKELLKFALTASNGIVLGAIDRIADAPTTFPTPNGGCHPLWVLGHLTMVEGLIPAVLYGETNAAAEWEPLFGEGTEPVADEAKYPPLAEVRARYEQLRTRNLQILESLAEADFEKATKAPPPARAREFATFGSTFLILALHQAMHRSHVTDALRAAGQAAAAKAA